MPRSGNAEQAQLLFEKLLSFANHLEFFSEEICSKDISSEGFGKRWCTLGRSAPHPASCSRTATVRPSHEAAQESRNSRRIGVTISGLPPSADARKVLEAFIRDSNHRPATFTAKTTFGDLAREYIDLNKPNWEASTSRVNVQIIEDHLIGKLGARPVRELSESEAELQRFINSYVENGSSRSLLGKLVLFLRAILDVAVDRGLIQRNPARKLRAKSRRRPCNLVHTLEECDLLLIQVSGADHLAVRLLIQLGLRSEELFALRRKDVQGSGLVIDEAIVDGAPKDTKTAASAARMYLTPDLELELKHYLGTLPEDPDGWLFPSSRKGVPTRPGNFLNRVLKPAAGKSGPRCT